MSATSTPRAAPEAARGAGLPPVTVFKLWLAGTLLDRVAREHVDSFADAAQAYAAAHRERSRRPLSAVEAGQVAAGLASLYAGDDPVGVAERLQASSLRADDPPPRRELLIAAGIATAPAFIDSVLSLVALLEMPNDVVESLDEVGGLDDQLAARVRILRRLELADARTRAAAAMDHFAQAAGASSGEALGLIVQTIWKLVHQAVSPISTSSSLTGSPEPTDGADDASSTTPAGATP